METYDVLILTDHRGHSSENGLYALAKAMAAHPRSSSVDVASRGYIENDEFFNHKKQAYLYGRSVNPDFEYDAEGHFFNEGQSKLNIDQYDLVWLRLPPPLGTETLDYLQQIFEQSVIVNRPSGIEIAGNKKYLLNFPSVIAPSKLCESIEEITEFASHFPIILKPLNNYGGKGILKIDGNQLFDQNKIIDFEEFKRNYRNDPKPYLAVKFLKNVTQGDKRIIVVNSEILGASLRLPKADSWICNVAMGGTSNLSTIEKEEREIVEFINPNLLNLGIVMYGIDTLVDDTGKRILSEINTTSIGGLVQIGKMTKTPVVEKAIDLIWEYYFTVSKK